MATRLTKTRVEGIAASAKDAYAWDGQLPGFGVKITPSGRRIYLVQYRPKGGAKVRRYTLGAHGSPWTAENARAAAQELLARVRLGEDPFLTDQEQRAAELEQQKAAVAQAAAATQRREQEGREAFDSVVSEFITRYAEPKNRRAAETARILKYDAVRSWSTRPIRTITRDEVVALLDLVFGRSPSVARALYAQLRRFFGWAVERSYLDRSPLDGVRGPSPRPARERWLADDEVELMWRACESIGPLFEPVIKLLLMTAQRREEVTGMRWAELDLVKAEWTIPGERTKNGKVHVVDLAPQAVAILQGLSQVGRLVFTTTGQTPLSGHSRAKSRLDAALEQLRRERATEMGQTVPETPIPPWRLHDLRRTAASGMASLGYPPHVIEAVLNHSSGVRGGLVAVYQRYEHRPERKAALLAWAEHLESLVAPRNVRST